MRELLEAALIALLLLTFFAISNAVHLRPAPFFLSRKVAHFGAGIAIFFLPLLFSSILWPALLSGGFLLLLLATHRTNIWHGFARPGRIAEVVFALSVFISIMAAWNIDPWLAVLPGLFMAFGDGVTGVVRYRVYRREVKGWWGTVACLVACALLALLVHPYWVGLVGAVVFSVAEKLCGDVGRIKIDDNLAAPLAALAMMVPLYLLVGG